MVRPQQKTRKRGRKEGFAPGPCQCHPQTGNERPEYGCLPGKELRALAKGILENSASATSLSLTKLRAKLEKVLDVSAKNESSFVNALPIDDAEKQRLQTTYLRPPQPSSWKRDPDKWLDSNDILHVMKQYEAAGDFKFMGPFPIDFASPDPYTKQKDKCLIGEVCSLDTHALRTSGITKIGIIFNLDPHTKDGSHWVANYIDLTKKHCYFFDSYGVETPKQIQKFMQWLTIQEPGLFLAYNAHRFQYKGSECGMYSMYFIIRMLMGEPFLHFCRRAPRDGFVFRLRDWIFST